MGVQTHDFVCLGSLVMAPASLGRLGAPQAPGSRLSVGSRSQPAQKLPDNVDSARGLGPLNAHATPPHPDPRAKTGSSSCRVSSH